MNLPAPKIDSPDRPAVALHDRAMDNLRYIRETMERSASFTHVSGIGGMAMGVIALAAGAAAKTATSDAAWLALWLGAAALSFAVAALLTARKSRSEGGSLLSGPARRFAWNMIPPLLAGVVLTVALVRAGSFDLLPSTWLLLYGAGIVTGGSYSVRPIPVMGVGFMVAGMVALLSPPAWGDLYMAAAFGGLHIVFGFVIWRKHGG
ncbi:MAG TPA: hypothetical protein VLA09_07255 [Longimicrobiales bacterium]|nr:hypothetical protein [Longimicrobiales bacterium]